MAGNFDRELVYGYMLIFMAIQVVCRGFGVVPKARVA